MQIILLVTTNCCSYTQKNTISETVRKYCAYNFPFGSYVCRVYDVYGSYLFVFSCSILSVTLFCVILSCFCPPTPHPQRVTQASTKRMLGTSSVQSALRTVSATEKAQPSVTARGAFTGLRKILRRWPVHVSSSHGAFVFTHNRVGIDWARGTLLRSLLRCSYKSSLVSRTYLCVKVCIKESLNELHGFCSAASSSLMIHWLSLRLHICIKLQFNRTNSPLIKKLFSCHWDRRGRCLGALQGEIVYLSFTERQSQAAADRLWIFPAVGRCTVGSYVVLFQNPLPTSLTVLHTTVKGLEKLFLLHKNIQMTNFNL